METESKRVEPGAHAGTTTAQSARASQSSYGSEPSPVGGVVQRLALPSSLPAQAQADEIRGLLGKSGGAPLPAPLQAKMEASFGTDLSSVRLHEGPSARSMGALALTHGENIHVASGVAAPETEQGQALIGHEIAHVVQQRAGRVAPTSSVGGLALNDDRGLEQEADMAGAAAARSEPAQVQGAPAPRETADRDATSGRSAGPSAVQCKVSVGGNDEPSFSTLWARVSQDGQITALTQAGQNTCKKILKGWVKAKAKTGPGGTSENRAYASDAELAAGLVGEFASIANLALEKRLAKEVYKSDIINGRVGSFITKLQTWQAQQDQQFITTLEGERGRYGWFYSGIVQYLKNGGRSLGSTLAKPPSNLEGRITFLADYALVAKDELVTWADNFIMSNDMNQARSTKWNPNESSPWVQAARQNGIPLNAGPSATTAQLLTLSVNAGATAQEQEALAWAIFAFFNKGLSLSQSGTHRYHEVFAVAAGYGVPYQAWQYDDVPDA